MYGQKCIYTFFDTKETLTMNLKKKLLQNFRKFPLFEISLGFNLGFYGTREILNFATMTNEPFYVFLIKLENLIKNCATYLLLIDASIFMGIIWTNSSINGK